jgi:hypothetical protein
MNKYIILYKSDMDPEVMMKNMTPEQSKNGMDMWMQWSEKAGSSILDLGAPLGKGQIVTKNGGSKAPLGVSGFSIMQGESIEDVKGKLKSHPHFMTPGMSSIEIYEFLPMDM